MFIISILKHPLNNLLFPIPSV